MEFFRDSQSSGGHGWERKKRTDLLSRFQGPIRLLNADVMRGLHDQSVVTRQNSH